MSYKIYICVCVCVYLHDNVFVNTLLPRTLDRIADLFVWSLKSIFLSLWKQSNLLKWFFSLFSLVSVAYRRKAYFYFRQLNDIVSSIQEFPIKTQRENTHNPKLAGNNPTSIVLLAGPRTFRRTRNWFPPVSRCLTDTFCK